MDLEYGATAATACGAGAGGGLDNDNDNEIDNDARGATATDGYFQATATGVPSTEFYYDGNVIDIDDESNAGTIWHNHHEIQNTSTDALLAMETNTNTKGEGEDKAAAATTTTSTKRAPNSRGASKFQAQIIEV